MSPALRHEGHFVPQSLSNTSPNYTSSPIKVILNEALPLSGITKPVNAISLVHCPLCQIKTLGRSWGTAAGKGSHARNDDKVRKLYKAQSCCSSGIRLLRKSELLLPSGPASKLHLHPRKQCHESATAQGVFCALHGPQRKDADIKLIFHQVLYV